MPIFRVKCRWDEYHTSVYEVEAESAAEAKRMMENDTGNWSVDGRDADLGGPQYSRDEGDPIQIVAHWMEIDRPDRIYDPIEIVGDEPIKTEREMSEMCP